MKLVAPLCSAALLFASASASASDPAPNPMLTQLDAGPVSTATYHGYDAYVCHAPSTGVAIRNNDNDGATELARLHNGDKWHVYRTHATEPSITPGWSLGFHPVGSGSINGFLKLAYVCEGAW